MLLITKIGLSRKHVICINSRIILEIINYYTFTFIRCCMHSTQLCDRCQYKCNTG